MKATNGKRRSSLKRFGDLAEKLMLAVCEDFDRLGFHDWFEEEAFINDLTSFFEFEHMPETLLSLHKQGKIEFGMDEGHLAVRAKR